MKISKLLLSAIFTLFIGTMSAQDLHFTMYDMAPMHLNPANTGAYEGTYRISGIYRDQWGIGGGTSGFGAFNGTYKTPTIGIDAPLLMLGKKAWLGAGLMFASDKAGTGGLNVTTFQLAAGLHYMLDKKGTQTISLGVQGGQSSRGLSSAGDLAFGNTDETAINTTDQDKNVSDFDLNIGLLFKTKIDKVSNFNIGINMAHLLSPDNRVNLPSIVGLTPTSIGKPTIDSEKLPLRFIGHLAYERQISDKFSIQPQAMYTTIASQSEGALQVWTGYKLDPESPLTLRGGLGHRFGRDLQVLLGVDYNDWRVGIAYDVPVGSISDVTNGYGAFELAVSYIGKVYKKPDVPPAIFCPKL